jgi:hypothetical protein
VLRSSRRQSEEGAYQVAAGRGQEEAGVRAIDAEETSDRQLLDSNVGLQAALRARATEMIRHRADHLRFDGRNYTRTDVERQASLMVRQETRFCATFAEFGPRRARLHAALTAAAGKPGGGGACQRSTPRKRSSPPPAVSIMPLIDL